MTETTEEKTVLISCLSEIPGRENEAIERYELLERYRGDIHAAYIRGIQDGLTEPLVLLLGPNEAKEIAEDISATRNIKDNIHIVVMNRNKAIKTLQRFQKKLHQKDVRNPTQSGIIESLRAEPRENHFYAMVIVNGKQLVEMPF